MKDPKETIQPCVPNQKKGELIAILNRQLMIFMKTKPPREAVEQYLEEKERAHSLITEI